MFNRFLNTPLHTGISQVNRRKVNPKNSSARNNYLLCKNLPSFDDFSVVSHDSKTFLLEIKESLSIIRDQGSMNNNIS